MILFIILSVISLLFLCFSIAKCMMVIADDGWKGVLYFTIAIFSLVWILCCEMQTFNAVMEAREKKEKPQFEQITEPLYRQVK